ncbi:hypothetical protein GH714_027330 [Hevea brasiliensis]|uniref:GST C-terminal domain-containing protein n=1 Tax=Hevea brasiliensis TaxID=3981 RepID=A0A6A6MHC8_HEVBR|nr:hypothetical protein GH714_027330 [Hevea brasiliensis]
MEGDEILRDGGASSAGRIGNEGDRGSGAGYQARPRKSAKVNKEFTLTIPSKAIMWILVPAAHGCGTVGPDITVEEVHFGTKPLPIQAYGLAPNQINQQNAELFRGIFQTVSKLRSAIAEEKEQLLEEFHHHLKLLENELELKKREFFGGLAIGYLDIVAFFVGHWFEVSQEVLEIDLITEEKHPHLSKWIAKLRKNDWSMDACLQKKNILLLSKQN